MKDFGSVLILLVTSKTSLSTADTVFGTVPELPPLLVPPPLLLVPAVLIAEIAEALVLMAVLIAVEMF